MNKGLLIETHLFEAKLVKEENGNDVLAQLAKDSALAKWVKMHYDTGTEAKEAKYQKAVEAWRKEIGKWAIANFSKAENLRTNYRSWNNNLNVDFDIVVKQGDFPQEPEKDFEVIHTHSYNEMKEELTNAIRILKMTDEEVVSTSTYNAIARYL